MACYDCEDCGRHKYHGGKCERWEYDCPFSHLEGYDKEEQGQIDEDVKTSLELKQDLKNLLAKYEKKFNLNWNYEDIIEHLKFAYTDLEDMTDEELIKEWNKIK